MKKIYKHHCEKCGKGRNSRYHLRVCGWNTAPKPKPLTKAQRYAQWEQIVIAGGTVRASKLPRTAAVLNRGRGAVVRILAVPLIDNRQLDMLTDLAIQGIMGQTPEEVAAWFIREGIIKEIKQRSKCKECGRPKNGA